MAIDTTGINTDKIGAMQQAIENWAKAVDAANITLAAKSVAQAMKGNNQVTQIKKLCQACDSYSNSLTSKLREYKNRLNDVKIAYAKNDADSTAVSSYVTNVNKLKS